MNGATAELWASSSRPARARSITTIGIIHQSFAAHRKASNSRMIPSRRPAARIALDIVIVLLSHDVVAEDEHVEAAPAEGREGVLRRVDDGLTAQVERGVEEHGHSGGGAEALDEVIVARIGFAY